MKRALAIAVVSAPLVLAACGNDAVPDGSPDAAAHGAADAPAGTQVTDVSGDITADTTWTGTVRVHVPISIAAGVTLTVAAGTTVQVAASASLTDSGTIDVMGTKAAPVTWVGLATDDWLGLSVPTGGAFTMTYGEWTGGNIVVSGGSFSATDSRLSQVTGDLLTASAGTITVLYSWLGLATGMADTTHCDMHFEGASNPTISVTHTNVSTSVYGVMFLTGTNEDFTSDNWFSNTNQVELTSAVTGDFSNGWFDQDPVSGTGITANNLSPTMITDAGPR